MGARNVSGRGVATVLLGAALLAAVVGFLISGLMRRPNGTTPTQSAQVQAVSSSADTATATAPAIANGTPTPLAAAISTAPTVPPVTVTPPVADATAVEFDPEGLYTLVSPAVVTIGNKQKIGPKATVAREANAGTGVIYDARGLILTNRHVIDGAETIEVTLRGGATVSGTLVGADPVADLAVVRIDPAAVPAVATLGDSSTVRPGQRVVAIGNPLQFEASITRGIVSGTDRSIGGMDGLVQTDAAISPGNSGGPLVNARGEVIGITTSSVRSNQALRIAFAIPSNTAKRLAGIIMVEGKVTRPYIGVTTELLSPARGEELKVKAGRGAYISEVTPNTPADKAGLRKADVIIAINATPVDRTNPLTLVLLDFKPGDTVTMTINRDGTEQKLPVTLIERPVSLDP